MVNDPWEDLFRDKKSYEDELEDDIPDYDKDE